jgi:hypothetical protein
MSGLAQLTIWIRITTSALIGKLDAALYFLNAIKFPGKLMSEFIPNHMEPSIGQP